MQRLDGGHTNESFVVDGGILRRSWPGKSSAQLAAERDVLAALPSLPFATPRLLRELPPEDGRRVQLFTRCPGSPGPRFLAPDDHARMRAAMSALRRLHTALATIPGASGCWLTMRLDSIRTVSPAALPVGTSAILDRIAAVIPDDDNVQWLHGDYHLGNLLWTDHTVSAVVDFDETGCGSATTEAALALLALARQPTEDRFTYDLDLWRTGRDAYGAEVPLLVDLFCAYQVLVHLAAFQRGSWTVEDSLGFWPCWNQLASTSRTASTV